jgi:uncharacterized protein (TIGR02246 family)
MRMGIMQELQATIDRYGAAYRARDSTACAAIFTEHAVLASPFGPTARGRDAIARIHAEWLSEGGEGKELQVIEAGVSGDLAWCLAAFTEGQPDSQGTSLNVFERQQGGWLIRMCSLNA